MSIFIVNRKLLMILLVTAFLCSIVFLMYSIKKDANLKVYTNDANLKVYINDDFKISLKYPEDWIPNPKYFYRFEGKDGFFQINATTGEGLSIDQVAEFDAYHILKPYGSSPMIKKVKVQGQEARLILPSSDQPKAMADHVGLIIEYPTPVNIRGTTYDYFILYSHKDFIEDIAKTLKFI